jgi:hypothetical protein
MHRFLFVPANDFSHLNIAERKQTPRLLPGAITSLKHRSFLLLFPPESTSNLDLGQTKVGMASLRVNLFQNKVGAPVQTFRVDYKSGVVNKKVREQTVLGLALKKRTRAVVQYKGTQLIPLTDSAIWINLEKVQVFSTGIRSIINAAVATTTNGPKDICGHVL